MTNYQEAIELNSEQEKAFNALKRAVRRCEKANVYFYLVLDNLGALNGDNVRRVEEGGSDRDPNCLHVLRYPSFSLDCSWADDTHYVVLYE